MKYKIDLHTHSKLSPDGSIDENDYRHVLETNLLNIIAITDHNTIEFALFCQKKLGNQIIVGEEISTLQGHLIGLFLQHEIKPHQDILKAADEIKSQGGLVYVPHPFDIFRKGIGQKNLEKILSLVDIVETCNGRMIVPYFNYLAHLFAEKQHLTIGFGSDSHDKNSLGAGCLLLDQVPTKQLASFSHGIIQKPSLSLLKFFMPKYNRLRKSIHI